MIRIAIVCLIIVIAGCARDEAASSRVLGFQSPLREPAMHPKVDFDHWAKLFPLAPGEVAGGEIITSPAHLCAVELVRKQYSRDRGLGRAVPVDIFLWSTEPAEKPYLTRLGGVPHRESALPWPTDRGKPFTFVAQFCFADSRDIVSHRIPNDVMLVFFKDDSFYATGSVHIEWSPLKLDRPMTAEECPAPSFAVPELSGHIYRTNEFPDSMDVFDEAGHDSCYLFPTTQSTKIGRETFFIQGDPRERNQELICALSSVQPVSYPPGAKWPFIGMETLPDDWNKAGEFHEWGKYQMIFGDVGCMYFMIDKDGNVSSSLDCY